MATEEKMLRIPLSDILVDNNWNARQGGWQSQSTEGDADKAGEDSEGGTGLAGLVMSIKMVGQDTPVDVRKNPKAGKPYQLVTGFRRFEALSRIAAEKVKIPGWDDGKPTVKALVRELTDEQSRALNLRENTERDNLSPADVAWSIKDMADTHKMTDVAIAQVIGKSQGYVSKLHRIQDATHPDILKAWREFPKELDPLSVDKRLKLSAMPKNEQKGAYAEMVDSGGGKGGGGGAWMKTAQAQAEKIGELLGILERLELISTDDLKFTKSIKVFVESRLLAVKGKSGDGATDLQWGKLADSMQEGYDKGFNPPEEEEEEEEADKE